MLLEILVIYGIMGYVLYQSLKDLINNWDFWYDRPFGEWVSGLFKKKEQ